ncbi:MAG: TIGR04076 family protein [Nakamurella sp.]
MTHPDPVPRLEAVPVAEVPVTTLHDLRVVVDRIEGRSVCGHRPGDAFTVTRSSQLRVEGGGHFCLYALSCVLPVLAAKQRAIDPGDWMSRDSEVACPDPDERLIMRIERGPLVALPTDELT